MDKKLSQLEAETKVVDDVTDDALEREDADLQTKVDQAKVNRRLLNWLTRFSCRFQNCLWALWH